ncbi:MAG TPA: AtpZ/AtpI family protein [Candidatus Kapabacteria bacterium]|jgi:F0F1-type ATP synthase assembly protein I|nr:AtpZ/AtpI family protein [Candidatus Kapabacteria bacterium]
MPEDLKQRARRELADQQKAMQETGPYLTLGIQLVLTILIFFGIGDWLDHHFHTTPLWIAIFTTFGAIGSLTYFIVTVLNLQKNSDNKAKNETKAK